MRKQKLRTLKIIKPVIFVGIPHLGNLRAELVYNLLSWQGRQDIEIHFFPHIQPTICARNTIVTEFLKTDMQYLFMIDADQYVQRDPFLWAKYDLDIVGGLCYIIKGTDIIPTILDKKVIENKEWQLEDGYQVSEFIIDDLMEKDATGTGCIMIHRRVLEKMQSPWFEYILNENGQLRIGNDFYFCEKAKQLGFKTYIDIRLVSGHFSTIDITAIGRQFTLLNMQIAGLK